MFTRLCALVFAALAVAAPGDTRSSPASGELVRHPDFQSAHVDSRNVTVWLPPGYRDGAKRYAVLYMHDGQNLFEAETAYAGEWGVDEAMLELMTRGEVRDAIVVGVWNTPKRYLEYYPQAAFVRLPAELQAGFAARVGGRPLSDAYLDFLVTELKPFIDRTYRTLPDRESTAVMGSSMGGLISAYALIRHPDVFGAAGAVSTHWPMVTPQGDDMSAAERQQFADAMLAVVADGLHPAKGRIWFDHGTINLDSFYGPHQARIDAVMQANGFRRGVDWETRIFEGADHNEASWRARLPLILPFLLPPRD